MGVNGEKNGVHTGTGVRGLRPAGDWGAKEQNCIRRLEER